MWILDYITKNKIYNSEAEQNTEDDVTIDEVDFISEPSEVENTLGKLREVQQEISNYESQLVRLETFDFPLLFSVLATLLLSAERIPSHRLRDGFVDKDEMQMALRVLKDEMRERNITMTNFDVDQFCKEVKSYIDNEEELRCIRMYVAELKIKERQLKESLKIV